MPSLIVESSGLRRGGPITSRVLIGRLPTNGISVADTRISRLHAWIDCDLEGLYYVADCGSLTGTRVNGEVVNQRAVLRDGDTIAIGRTQIAFRESNDLPPGTQPMNLSGQPPMENVEEAGVLFECVCGAPIWFKSTAIGQIHKCRHCGRSVTIPEQSGVRAVPVDEPHSISREAASHPSTGSMEPGSGMLEAPTPSLDPHAMTDFVADVPADDPQHESIEFLDPIDHGIADDVSPQDVDDHDLSIPFDDGVTGSVTEHEHPGNEPIELGLTDSITFDSEHGFTDSVEPLEHGLSDSELAHSTGTTHIGHGLTDPAAHHDVSQTGTHEHGPADIVDDVIDDGSEAQDDHGLTDLIHTGEPEHSAPTIDGNALRQNTIAAIQAELAAADNGHSHRPASPEFLPDESPAPEFVPEPVVERQSLFARRRGLAEPHPLPQESTDGQTAELEIPGLDDVPAPSPVHETSGHESSDGLPSDPFDAVFEEEHGMGVLTPESDEPASAPPSHSSHDDALSEKASHAHHPVATDCSVCHTAITVDEATTTCPSCGLSFHAECWQENQGCSAYGCPQVGALASHEPATHAGNEADLADDLVHYPEADESFPWQYLFLAGSVLGTLLGLIVFGAPALFAAIGAFVFRIRYHNRETHKGVILTAIVLGVVGVGIGIATSYYWWFGGLPGIGGLFGGHGPGRLPDK